MEASAQVKSLEEANANQAAEIERLLEAQISGGDNVQADAVMKEEYAELEDDCLKYVSSRFLIALKHCRKERGRMSLSHAPSAACECTGWACSQLCCCQAKSALCMYTDCLSTCLLYSFRLTVAHFAVMPF